ncbi:Glycosyltransferase [Granulibacter bethesdensis CGDNIH1]|uniref:Glycosyltransferase n=2 Tax=Granulibacter bethesdensis TaxID=364410 RepID=Q0BVL0_GRABC|nr:Glycosyltransferase [Granulibacter bethesdensis CGDNIH1]APH50918.1 Glycosyltransferase [Granulibacter bethesdensis]APH63613.1 Glycosyltransferase [Granulibacter bethesdensis]
MERSSPADCRPADRRRESRKKRNVLRHEMRQILIFRHNLFRVSEPFVTEPAEALARYRPLYMGWLRYGEAPSGAESIVLGRCAGTRPSAAVGWQMLSRDPGPYLRRLGKRRPALIHAHFGVDGSYALPLARRLGVKLVTTFHGFDATLSLAGLMTSPPWAWYALMRHRLAREGALFLCASAFIRRKVLALGFPAERTRVHYIGVDCAGITPRAPEEETRTILHVARLVEVKGTASLIRAFARLNGRHENVRLDIIGKGPLLPGLRDLARALGVEARVRFLGAWPHEAVLHHMRQAAMLVQPSVRTRSGREEGLGMVLLEAAASGVPAIGSLSGGIPEAVRDGETGFLTPERDVEALARRMNDLLDDDALRRRMGHAARRMAEREFDRQRQTAGLETLYDSVLDHAG